MPRHCGQFPVGDFQGSVFVELLRDGTQVSLGGHSIFEAVHLGPFSFTDQPCFAGSYRLFGPVKSAVIALVLRGLCVVWFTVHRR